ncbi:hypothetical protein LMG22037_04701 [Paraburkholderia phenoliruptrix]|uniref:Uncharacterized protein n=1 Tax=Paraburkholderia phenoliruptrix TaxID=252970 RepID=A0A6J5BXB7_9BURK|nr:hypothetical protein [Paraburkholderia phenoliruptrix]CAB3720234.1 hypothetical protein LMG22037_04701 [Paraburkholderia phenoliruptrix]
MTKKCPLLKKACIESDCAFWTHMLGMHPQTGAPVDQWGCAVTWLPLLLVENSRHARGVQAAVESARNEITARQDVLNCAVRVARQSANQVEGGQHEQLRDR